MHLEQLNKRHQLFLSEFVQNGFNASEAYKTVYEDTSEEAARSSASRLLSMDNIQKALEEMVSTITPEYILGSIASIAKDSKRSSDKLRALELLGKYHALFKDASQNVNFNGQISPEDIESLRSRLSNTQVPANKALPKIVELIQDKTGNDTS